ncbi:hypothetical protein Bbelb_195750 [Branchiostoma belcheri]|nr:hypothetical protein Bbelb_195750 [Branchiostoma belcheri]
MATNAGGAAKEHEVDCTWVVGTIDRQNIRRLQVSGLEPPGTRGGYGGIQEAESTPDPFAQNSYRPGVTTALLARHDASKKDSSPYVTLVYSAGLLRFALPTFPESWPASNGAVCGGGVIGVTPNTRRGHTHTPGVGIKNFRSIGFNKHPRQNGIGWVSDLAGS